MHIQSKKQSHFGIHNQKGITLISLTITAIVMIILATVTIQLAIGDGGLVQTAKESKKIQELEMYKTKIEILITNWELQKSMNDSITLDELWQDLIDEGIIGSKNDVEGPDENGNYIVTTPAGPIEIQIGGNGTTGGEGGTGGTEGLQSGTISQVG